MKVLQVALANLRDATKPVDAADRVILLTEIESLRTALHGLARIYSDAWDRVGGGLVILDIPRFEEAHKAARIALGTPLFDLDTGEMEA